MWPASRSFEILALTEIYQNNQLSYHHNDKNCLCAYGVCKYMIHDFDIIVVICNVKQRWYLRMRRQQNIHVCLQMYAGDGLPNHVCEECISQVNSFCDFKLMVEASDCSLRDFIRRQQDRRNDQVRKLFLLTYWCSQIFSIKSLLQRNCI